MDWTNSKNRQNSTDKCERKRFWINCIVYMTTEATKNTVKKTILFPRCFPAAWLVCVGLSGPRSGVTNVVDPAILSQLTTTIICQTVRLLLHTWGPVAMLFLMRTSRHVAPSGTSHHFAKPHGTCHHVAEPCGTMQSPCSWTTWDQSPCCCTFDQTPCCCTTWDQSPGFYWMWDQSTFYAQETILLVAAHAWDQSPCYCSLYQSPCCCTTCDQSPCLWTTCDKSPCCCTTCDQSPCWWTTWDKSLCCCTTCDQSPCWWTTCDHWPVTMLLYHVWPVTMLVNYMWPVTMLLNHVGPVTMLLHHVGPIWDSNILAVFVWYSFIQLGILHIFLLFTFFCPKNVTVLHSELYLS